MICLTVLIVATLPERRSDMPILYWTTDANEARTRQIQNFEEWMARRGEQVDLELDSGNSGAMKVIIQAASGVGSEIIDVYQGAQLRQYVAAGVLIPLNDVPAHYGLDPEFRDLAAKYGFGPDKTYQAVREEIMVDGKQYTFPCNVSGWPLLINRALLERENLPLPKYDWNWNEFLTWCKAVRKIGKGGKVTRFAVMPFGAEYLWPGNGASIFNETMTRCVLDSPQAIEATQYYFDLMFKHDVMPTPVEEAAATKGGWGHRIKWLGNEQTVAHQVGRWGLVTLRKYHKDFRPDVALIPHKVMAMQFVSSRSAGINAGVADPLLVARFQQFLASKEYNELIVDDADALPPNPAMAEFPEFKRPPKFPGEHPPPGEIGAHEKFLRAVTDHGVGREYSPFILPPVVEKIFRYYQDGIANKELSVEEGMRLTAEKINEELARTVKRDRQLQDKYAQAMALQKEFDRYRRQRRPLGPDMIEKIANPVIRRLREAGK